MRRIRTSEHRTCTYVYVNEELTGSAEHEPTRQLPWAARIARPDNTGELLGRYPDRGGALVAIGAAIERKEFAGLVVETLTAKRLRTAE